MGNDVECQCFGEDEYEWGRFLWDAEDLLNLGAQSRLRCAKLFSESSGR